ncbi:MAG TPA: hypothetical protein VJB57_09480 [Dehalococcoidia bacterium]|nr:hypothetical protein [Dehalococcoidia bacterium]
MSSYWDSVLTRRIRRRHALAASGGMALGSALLAACGGGDDGGGGEKQPELSKLLTPLADTSKQAKRGGTLQTSIGADPVNFDIYNFNITLQGFVWAVGSLLITLEPDTWATRS